MVQVRRQRGPSAVVMVEPVEPRQMLSATVTKALPASSLTTAAATVSLSSYFSDPAVTGTVAQFSTIEGKIDVQLYDTATPKTVANFLSYVTGGAYTNSIFHRDVPGFVLQGGGFTTTGAAIPEKAPVVNEYSSARPNVAGTIAMAKLGSGPNTATNQWFFNLADNSSNLDNQNGGFTVFGQVIENTMTVVNKLAAFAVVNASGINSAFDSLPVINPNGTFTASNLATVYSVGTVAPLSYAVTSSRSSVVAATLTGSTLTLTPKATAGGTATVTVTATDLGGKSVSSKFTVTVAAAKTASIAGTVFKDANANAKLDAGEVGAGGFTVYLDTNDDGKVSAGEPTAVTGTAGTYSFGSLAAGTYHVRIVPNAADGETVGSGGYTTTLAVAQKATGDNFGITDGSISGTVFNDLNRNSKLDAGEAGVSGWTVYLDTNDDGKLSTGEPSFKTGTGGTYSFTGLAAGTYHVRVVATTGVGQTLGSGGYTTKVAAGQAVAGDNFGVTYASIVGTAFLDANENSKLDAGELGQSGWTVYLDTNDDGKLSNGEPSFKTGTGGTYSFTGLTAGTYHVRLVAIASYGQTVGGGGYTTALTAGQVLTGENFGVTLASIAGTVFLDKNANGKKDAGEAGLSGWTVFLDANDNGKLDAGEAHVVTDGSGDYTFADLTPGTYRVQEATPSGYKRTTPSSAGIVIVVAKGRVVTGQNLGYLVVGKAAGEIATAAESISHRDVDA